MDDWEDDVDWEGLVEETEDKENICRSQLK